MMREPVQGEFMSDLAKVAEQAAFSGAVRVTAGDRVVASAAFGHADRATGVDNTADTRFAIASGTKLLTALGIGALIDESRLTMDTRLRDVVSFDLSGVAKEVTIGQLLTHTSGVYDYYDEELIDDFDAFTLSIPPIQLLCPLDYLPMVVGGVMKFVPGERFSYSNGGYVLLGMLLQELCDDYHQFVESRIMQRAGMESSGFFRFDQLPTRTANGYIETAHGWRTNTETLPIIGGPDGGAFVTTADMQRLWRALFAGEIVSPALTRVFVRKAVRCSDTVFYGHGLWIRDDGSQPPVIYAEGADAGVSFNSACHGDSIVATVVGNSSIDASPIVGAVDDFVQREFPAEERLFPFEL